MRFLDTQTTCNDQSIQPATPCTVTPPPHPGPLLSSSLFSCTHSPAMKTLYYYVVVPRASCSRAVPAVRGCRGARLSSGRGSGGRPRRAGRVRPRRRPRCLRRRAASCPAGGGCASKYVRKWIVATHYVREALAQLTSSTNLQPKYALLHRIAHHEAHLQHVEVSRRGVVSSEP